MSADPPLLRALGRALRGGWRLFTLRRAAAADFLPSPQVFAALVVVDVLLLFAFAFAVVGLQGEINTYELPRALMIVPLALALGMLAQQVDGRIELLRLPVALASVGIWFTASTSVLYLLAQHQWLPFVEAYWTWFDDIWVAWSAAVVVLAGFTLTSGALIARTLVGLAGIVLLILPSLWMPVGLLWAPRYDEAGTHASGSFYSLAHEGAFYAQHGALEKELSALEPERPGVTDVYVLAAGLYAGEDVFMKEINMLTALLGQRFDAAGRTVTLINNAKTITERPVASVTSIQESLRHIGSVMNVEEDVLVLYVSSHGSSKHELVVDFRPLRFAPVTPKVLKAALDDSGVRWKVIIVSACYSGGFIDPLKDDRTLIITASSASRESFGCGHLSEATYLAQALFGDALRRTRSFEKAYEQAHAMIEQWEREKGYTPSQPQLHVGPKIRAKLAELERRLARQ